MYTQTLVDRLAPALAIAAAFVWIAAIANPYAVLSAGQQQSADFESSNGQYLMSSDTQLDIPADLTIEAWVRLESALTTGQYFIAGKYDQDDKRSYALYLEGIGTNTSLTFANSSACSNGIGVIIPYVLDVGKWYHLAVSKGGTTATIYVNGESIGSGSVFASQCASPSPFSIGVQVNSNGIGSFFDGLIEEVKLWNIARSASEIVNDMFGNSSSPNLIAYWKFNNSSFASEVNSITLSSPSLPTFSNDVPTMGSINGNGGGNGGGPCN